MLCNGKEGIGTTSDWLSTGRIAKILRIYVPPF